MSSYTIILNSPVLLCTLVGVIGLMVGSFLNVVIYRLPIMLQRGWKQECQEFLELAITDPSDNTFNLALPGSHCPICNAKITAMQNIPVFSYLWLKGKCANCQTHISMRYPLVEALSSILSIVVAYQLGGQIETLYALLLTWTLIALSGIDFDHQLLPDNIVLPILWLGLFLSLFNIFTDPVSSIIGAIAGYLFLWTIYQLFKLLTGKEGMGYGDFKLLALLGAWLGWQYLPLIILLSSLVGAIIGTAMIIFVQRDKNVPIPFGPYLAIAGWIALLWGDEINTLYLTSTGLL
ncbi:leader peptidase/N-methyltransferase [Bathymodiolus japonicus methanotrophic gill symbiont]|uniref:prepilin peptidase n=1 Tax=Bathymodiolus japonicus methanotrophic gill symbiont TaxID=113269 RepID=UPI001B607AD5|nr:A24 family peptidase [Bathymodiolus japonicus methanotrophic gill symbiont]GFO72113.1 leader peptidase/N-methyltransferase [Bathymodiolus japonicus methanotrophic gill symbiont]